MNTSNLIDLIAQNKKYQTHRRNIESIMSKQSHSLSFRKKDALSNYHLNRDRAYRFSNKAKQEAVQKENDIILKKIIDVNRRAHQSVQQANDIKRQLSHNNLSNLRKKLTKTNEENQKLANKLVSTTSKLSQNLLNEDYHRYAQIKQRLKKYTMDQQTGMVVPKKIKSLVSMTKLDPISSYDIQNSRMEESSKY